MTPKENLQNTAAYLGTKKKVLFLTTSNRWSGEKNDIPKSSQLAAMVMEAVKKLPQPPQVKIIDISKLKIYNCEGNVSTKTGNTCGLKDAVLKDAEKNPSGCHRCWASINNPDDELWQISKELLQSDAVVFFGSVRWGQMNSFYQKLIERLTWMENRHTTLGEDNIIKNIDAGLIISGHNWNEENVQKTQQQVLEYFGFNVVPDLCWFWRYTDNAEEESPQSYSQAARKFGQDFGIL